MLALSHNPILEPYKTLRKLVRRVRDDLHVLRFDRDVLQRSVAAEDENKAPGSDSAERELRKWLEDWLTSTPGYGYNWLFSPSQLETLLGSSIYSASVSSSMGQRGQSSLRPNQQHMEHIIAILGPNVVDAMIYTMDKGRDDRLMGMSLEALEEEVRMDHEEKERAQGEESEGPEKGRLMMAQVLEKAFPVHPLGEFAEALEWLEQEQRMTYEKAKVAQMGAGRCAFVE
jgi:hypothetical protein